MEPHRIVHYMPSSSSQSHEEIGTWTDDHSSSSKSESPATPSSYSLNASKEAHTADFCHVKWIGFDLDHALARYKLRKLLPLIYDGLVEYLVLTMGWPANRLVRGQQFQDNRGATQTVEWRPEFVGKGIIFEFSSGNLIKLDQAGRICQAAHGQRFLTEKERTHQYGDTTTWKYYEELCQQKKHPDFLVFLTYFDISAQLVLARMVDILDQGLFQGAKQYSDIGSHLFAAFDHMFDNVTGFEQRRGMFFREILENPMTYLHKRPRLRGWILHERQKYNRRFFLITNSHSKFASFTLAHSLGDDWRSLFDIAFVHARKPRWFHEPCPAYNLDEQGIREGSIARTMHLKKGESEALPLYCQGSYVPFEYLLNIIGGVPTVNVDEKGTVVQTDACVVSNAIGDSSRDNIEDNEVADSVAESVVDANIPRGFHSANEALSSSQDIMYIGDHIHGDVVPTSKLRKWISVAVVEELRETFPQHASSESRIRHLTRPRRESSDFYHDEDTSDELGFSGDWGSFFTTDEHSSNEKRSRRTYFCSLLEKFSHVAVSDAENLCDMFSESAKEGKTV